MRAGFSSLRFCRGSWHSRPISHRRTRRPNSSPRGLAPTLIGDPVFIGHELGRIGVGDHMHEATINASGAKSWEYDVPGHRARIVLIGCLPGIMFSFELIPTDVVSLRTSVH